MSAIGSLQCPIIVGRDELLELADRRLTEAVAGHGQLLLLAGEAGVGKTRLLGAIRRQARSQGFEVVNGSVAPQDINVPTALIMDLARTFRSMPGFGSLGDDLLAQRVDETADALGSRRILVLDMVDRILSALSGPILIDFEDIQWADDMSLEIIGELAKRVRDRPVLIVGAYRTEELPPGAFLREWRARLISQRLAEEVRLAPLTREQTALMTTLILNTGLPAPREVVQAVHERTNGFPLHIEELLGALDPDARIDGRKIREAQVPDTIEDAILARISQLSPDAREVARAGAVIGRCFIPEVLAGIMDRPLSDLDAPLEELVQKSYLYDAGDPGWLDYRHQLLRDVLYRTVPPTELRRLHARAAEFGTTLDGQTEIHSSVHFERAGLRPQAYRSALSGAEKSGRSGSRRESFELYRRAVANIPDDLPLIDQAKLYQDYANAAEAIEHLDVVVEAATIARERYRAAGRPVEAAVARLSILNATRKDGSSTDERRRLFDEVTAELDALPASVERDQAVLDALGYEVILDLDQMQLAEAAAANERYRELASAVTEGEYILDVEFNQGMLEVVSGEVDAGLERLLKVAREGREHAWEGTGVTAYRVHATMAARVMDYRKAESAMLEGLRYADAIEQSHCRQQMATTTALMAWAAGRWDEAVGIANQELVERGCRRGVVGALDVLGYVALGRGDVDEARRWLDESYGDTARMRDPELVLPSLWGIAELALVAGEPAEAARRCNEALELAHGERALVVPFIVTGARACLAMHRPDEAERWLDRLRAHLAGWAMAEPALAHAEGLVKLALGSLSASREALDAAVRGWDELGRIWEVSWARLDLAHCLLRMNRYGEASALVSAVRTTAGGLASRPLMERADELARIGRGRGTIEEPWHPLTAREFEVARLIAEGLTNGEIADQLDIAPKTASSHVEHILAKLGVTRRAEIAAWTATVGRAATADRAGGGTAVATRR